MAVALHERGLFTWPEWAAALAGNVKHTPGEDYYFAWLRTLETLLAERGVAETSEVDLLADAWRRAANATPHGKPILLENDPQRR